MLLLLLCYVWYHELGSSTCLNRRRTRRVSRIRKSVRSKRYPKGQKAMPRAWMRASLLAQDLGHKELSRQILQKKILRPPVVHLCGHQGFLEPPWVSLGKGSKCPHKHIASLPTRRWYGCGHADIPNHHTRLVPIVSFEVGNTLAPLLDYDEGLSSNGLRSSHWKRSMQNTRAAKAPLSWALFKTILREPRLMPR